MKRKLEYRANIIKSLAHPSRLLVVQTLSEGDQSVSDLTTLIGSDMSTVSKHLSLLKNAGIIQDEKRGNQVFYKLNAPCVLNFLKCIERVIERTHKHTLMDI